MTLDNSLSFSGFQFSPLQNGDDNNAGLTEIISRLNLHNLNASCPYSGLICAQHCDKLVTYINILLSCKGRGGVTPFTVETVEAEVGKQGSVNAGG